MKGLTGKIRKLGKHWGARWKSLSGKKKWAAAAMGAVLLLAAAAGVFYAGKNSRTPDGAQAWQNGRGMAQTGMEGEFWCASGLTSVGLLEDTWELDFLDTPLVVEKTFLHLGDEVSQKTPVFQVTQETLEAGRTQLEKEQKRTRLAGRQGLLDYETGKIEAKMEYDKALIAGQYAQDAYDSVMAQAQGQVDSLQKQIKEAQELVDTYKASVENNYYYTYYKVGETKQLYEENFTYLMQLYGDWGIAELENSSSAASGYTGIPSSLTESAGSNAGTSSGGGMSSLSLSGESGDNAGMSSVGENGSSGTEAGSPSGMPGSQSGRQVSDEASRLAVYQLFEEEVTREARAYQEAKEQYEEASAKAAAGLEAAKSELKVLQAQLTEAQIDFETQKITAQAEAEQKKAESERAETVYASTLDQLAVTYEELMDEAEEAQKNLEQFENTIGDGYFYAGGNGTVLRNELKAGQELSDQIAVAVYSDPGTVTVSVSVDQEQIAQVGIGDPVLAMIDGYGLYEGKVTSFDPVTQSQSRSRAEYTVTVTLDGTEGEELEANLTAYVYFGLSEEQKEEFSRQITGKASGRTQEEKSGRQEQEENHPAQGKGEDSPAREQEGDFPAQPAAEATGGNRDE